MPSPESPARLEALLHALCSRPDYRSGRLSAIFGKGRPWVEKGCEVAIASISDADRLTKAFYGVEGVFLVTPPDFDPEPGFPKTHAAIAAVKAAIFRRTACEGCGPGAARSSVIEINRLFARVYRRFGAHNDIGIEHSLVIRTTECAAIGARVAHGSNCEIARGTLLALGPLRSSWPLGSRWPPRACRTFLPFTAGETDRQQDNQRNRRCFHTRAPRPQGRPGGRIATLSLFGDRPPLHDTITGGRPPGRKFPTPIGGLTIISGNKGWRNCHGGAKTFEDVLRGCAWCLFGSG